MKITREGRTIDGVFHKGGTLYCANDYEITFFYDEYYEVHSAR